MLGIWSHALRRRRTGLIWWSIGIAGMVILLAVAYASFRGNSDLDTTFAKLPPGVQALLGLSTTNTLTSPAGYLNSQFFANILPVMLLVFTIGIAAWTIAGAERAGTLELLLANPIGRTRVAVARLAALITLLAILTVVCVLALVASAPASGLNRGLDTAHLIAACAAAALMALTFAALAFAIGAATGNRAASVATASALAVAGYVLDGLANQVTVLRHSRAINPWHWLIDSDPLRNGLTWQSWLLPIATTAIVVSLGLIRLARRDLR